MGKIKELIMNQKQKVIEYKNNLYVKCNLPLKHFEHEVGTIYTKDCLEGYIPNRVTLYIDEEYIKLFDKEQDDVFCLKYDSTTEIEQKLILYDCYSYNVLFFNLKINKNKTGVQLIDIYMFEELET